MALIRSGMAEGGSHVKTIATWAGLLVGIAALVLQFVLTVTARLGTGDSIFGAVVYYFTFFTILTNLTLVLVYASELWPRQWLNWFRRPATRGMMVAAIVLVMGFYHFILAPTWDPQGWFKVADVILHYVTPVFYVAWWVLFARHGTLQWSDVAKMLLPPILYLIYVMIRGAIVSEYPYPILRANELGYGPVAINVFAVLIVLAALCTITIAVDRALTRVDMPGP